MPDGKIHDNIAYITTPIVMALSAFFVNDFKCIAIITISYLFASLMFNGDLDTNSRPYNRWFIFKMIWIPYQLMFNHRSIFTHGIIIGTVIRLLYLGIIPFIIIYIKGNLDIITSIDLNIIILIFVGLELGSAAHTIADKIY